MKMTGRGWVVALATVLMLAASVADARSGRGGGGLGSRGSRTFDAPAATTTAPRPAAPIERSTTQPGQPGPGVNQAVRPPAAQRGPAGFFANRGGFFGGMMGGLLGAGLFGLLFGSGLMGGLGGLASILGLLVQVALIGGLIWLALRFFQRRNQPAYAGAAAGSANAYQREATPVERPRPMMGGGSAGPAARATRTQPLSLTDADFTAFERLLGAVQTAYGQEDVAGLRRHATAEVAEYLEQELRQNEAQGIVNRVSAVKLLQGDLSEAWREGDSDYATVAMRFELIDVEQDRTTGAVVSGDPERPIQATEIWTFLRPRGGDWVLSAIQPA